MTTPRPSVAPFLDETDWRKDTHLARTGFRDLEYLPKGQTAWDMTLAATAYSARRLVREHVDRRPALTADLNLWATMHGAPSSGRYEELGDDALVLWHGTSALRAEKIRQHGLVCKRGVWATTEPFVAHSYTRGRSRAFQAGSAMICLVIDKNEWHDRASLDSPTIARFHCDIPADCIKYVLLSDRIDFVGRRAARSPKSWGIARFKKRSGRWLPCSKAPVRLDGERSYSSLSTWLAASVERIMGELGCATASEIFSSLYATIDPWDALEHDHVFDAIERLCQPIGRVHQVKLFRLANEA